MKRLVVPIALMMLVLCYGYADAEKDAGAPLSPVVDGRSTGKSVLYPKLVMHLDWDREEVLKLALENVKNLFKEIPPERASVHFVMNGKAVNLFRKDRAGEHGKTIKELSAKGVKFRVCRNAMANNGLAKDDMLDVCEIVPAGIVELIILQQDGYAYVKP
jgi:uncharacterized protein